MTYVTLGVALCLLGFMLCLAAVAVRAERYPDRCVRELRPRYSSLLILSLIGNSIAFFGFRSLVSAPGSSGADYSTVLSILSLLATGVITGNFVFSYRKQAEDEAFLVNLISIWFMALFYLLFGAISFYMGQDHKVHGAPGIAMIAPLIMSMILVANALFDFWDYRA